MRASEGALSYRIIDEGAGIYKKSWCQGWQAFAGRRTDWRQQAANDTLAVSTSE